MMDDKELRLECLKLASDVMRGMTTTEEIVQSAKEMYDFAIGMVNVHGSKDTGDFLGLQPDFYKDKDRRAFDTLRKEFSDNPYGVEDVPLATMKTNS